MDMIIYMESEILLVILAFILILVAYVVNRGAHDESSIASDTRRRVKFAKAANCRKYGKQSGRIISDTTCSV